MNPWLSGYWFLFSVMLQADPKDPQAIQAYQYGTVVAQQMLAAPEDYVFLEGALSLLQRHTTEKTLETHSADLLQAIAARRWKQPANWANLAQQFEAEKKHPLATAWALPPCR